MPTLSVHEIDLYYELHDEVASPESIGLGKYSLLFIHGLGSSTQDWQLQVDAFKSTYTVITVDVRGHGQSSKPTGPYSIRQFADDIAELLRLLKISSVHIIGLSMGGMIAAQMALDHAHLVQSVTVINAPPDMRPRRLKDKLTILQRKILMRLFGMKKVGVVLANRLFPDSSHAETRQVFAARWAQNDINAYRSSLNAILDWCITDRLSEIAAPLLVMVASEDYTPLESKEVFLTCLSQTTLVVIHDSHHAIPVEFPDKFNAALLQFLEQPPA
jgi:3-oxoadipate enol-lactonase